MNQEKKIEKQTQPPSAVESSVLLDGWQHMETAPKDGTEIMAYREDCGIMLIRWQALEDIITDGEMSIYTDEELQDPDWFFADFIQGGRLETTGEATHWMPLPDSPVS